MTPNLAQKITREIAQKTLTLFAVSGLMSASLVSVSLISGTLAFSTLVSHAASAEPIPVTGENWQLSEKGAAIADHKGRPSLRINRGAATLKGAPFKNGIIEFDISMKEERGFGGVYFREQGLNSEYFYLRAHQSGNPDANQYVPRTNGVSAWQIYYGERYAVPTTYNFGDWIHVKLAVKDNKMDVYIDSDKPVLHVDNLAFGVSEGGIRFGGAVQDFHYSNINITRTDDVTLVGTAPPLAALPDGIISTFDVGTRVLPAADVEAKLMLNPAHMTGQTWQRVKVGEKGIANLSEVAPRTREINTLLVRLRITADKAQTLPIKYGFSDRVTVFLNGKAIAHGDDSFVTRDYRFLGTVGLYDTLFAHLNEGENELIFAVTEGFGGWAITAQVDDIPGISIR